MRLSRWIRYKLPFLWEKTPQLGKVHIRTWGTANTEAKQINEIPKKIWIYWNNYPIDSPTVEICLAEINRLHPNYKVVVVHQETLLEHLPNFPLDILKKSPALSSDLIRLKLLSEHGGFYLDASTLLSENLDWARALQQQDGTEAVLYYTDENTISKEHPMLESSFIGATEGSKFIKEWLKEFELCLSASSSKEYMDKFGNFDVAKFPLDLDYYPVYLTAQVVMRKNQDFRLTIIRAEDDFFLYSLGIRKKWGEMAMAEILLLNKTPDPKPNTVKLIRYARKRLDFYIKRGMYKEGSWMGDLLLKRSSK